MDGQMTPASTSTGERKSLSEHNRKETERKQVSFWSLNHFLFGLLPLQPLHPPSTLKPAFQRTEQLMKHLDLCAELCIFFCFLKDRGGQSFLTQDLLFKQPASRDQSVHCRHRKPTYLFQPALTNPTTLFSCCYTTTRENIALSLSLLLFHMSVHTTCMRTHAQP